MDVSHTKHTHTCKFTRIVLSAFVNIVILHAVHSTHCNCFIVGYGALLVALSFIVVAASILR